MQIVIYLSPIFDIL